MKHIVSSLYAEYGRYIDAFRAIPKSIDCLKPVERRLLISVHQVARKKLEKSAKVIGTCIGNYHPHGDSSTYDALVNLVQRGFVDGQGNWGRYGLEDSRAAAYRYTECKANDVLHSIFEHFLKFVPWEPLELEDEPLYIPFPIPLGLIGSGVTTGIGFHITRIPRFNLKDLVQRLVELLENKTLTTIIPIIQDCTLYEDSPGEFEKLLTTGEGRIQIVPNTKIGINEMVILGRNPLVGFNGLKSLNEKYEETNGVPMFSAIDLWDYKCNSSINIKITNAGRSKLLTNDFINKILLSISSIINFRVNVVVNNSVVLKSIDDILLENYDKWKDANLKFYQNQLEYNLNKLEELKIIQVIREILKNNPTIKTIDEIVKLNTSTYIESEIRSVCSKHSIKTLIEAHIDINSVQSKINSLTNTINDIDNVVLNEIKGKFLK